MEFQLLITPLTLFIIMLWNNCRGTVYITFVGKEKLTIIQQTQPLRA